MFITELFESAGNSRVIVVYPGRFQPFHKGHKAVFEYLTKTYPNADVFICTSDKVAPPKSPFNFQEKLVMMQLTGVSPKSVVQSSQPYQAKEILQHYNPESDIVLYAVSQKDMDEDPRFSFAPKKDGSPSYFQKFTGFDNVECLAKHGYIVTVPTFNFDVLGQPMKSASEVREQFARADEQTKKAIIKDLFGAYSDQVFQIMNSKIAPIYECAGVGVIAKNKKMANDPRYKMSMTVDVHPDTPEKNMRSLGLI